MEQGYNEAIEGWDMKYKPKQEAIEDAERFVEENFKGLSDFIEDEDILIWYKALIVSAITDYQYQPKQKAIEKKVSEKLAGYVHEIDSLHISKRELWKKLAAEKLILIEKIAAQEIEIASLKSKIKELQSDYMAVQTEIQSNESK